MTKFKSLISNLVSNKNDVQVKRCQFTTGVRQASQAQFFENLYLSDTKEFLFVGKDFNRVRQSGDLFLEELKRLNVDSPVVENHQLNEFNLIYQYINDGIVPIVLIEVRDYQGFSKLRELKTLADNRKIILLAICDYDPLPHEYNHLTGFSCVVVFELTSPLLSMTLINSTVANYLDNRSSVYRVRCRSREGQAYLLEDIYMW